MKLLPVFLFLLVSIMLFLTACTQKITSEQPAAPDAAPAAETEIAEETAEAAELPVEEPVADAAAPAITGDSVLEPKSQLAALDSNVEVTKEQAIIGETRDDRKFESTSWFSALKCERYVGSKQGTFGTGTKKEDKLSFRFTNNDNREYNLSQASAFSRIGADENSNIPLRISINGNRLTTEETQQCCGTVIVKPGQTMECISCPANLRYPEQHKYVRQNTELINNLESRSRFSSSQIEFKCLS